MIAQGTDGLSRGSFLKGVMTGKDMLAYVDLAKGAIERQPTLVDYVQSWVKGKDSTPTGSKNIASRRMVPRRTWSVGRKQGFAWGMDPQS